MQSTASKMHATDDRMPILIQGATGRLGGYIANRALENPRLLVNILVIDPSSNKELCSRVESAGGKVMKADLADKESLKDVTKGMHTVICTIGDVDEKACVEGQMALIDDCIKNGVKRYVPSDFGMDCTKIDREELLATPTLAYKLKIDDYLKKVKISTMRFYVGCLAGTMMETLRYDHTYWGDENLKQDITTYENAARLVVAAVARPDMTGRITYVGGRYTPKEMKDIYNKVRGESVELKRAGSLDDLRKLMESKKKEGDMKSVGHLALLMLVYDPRTKFSETMNKDFSEVKPTSFEEFLKERPDIKL